ncbi:Threonine/homoserine efflux transporter RhtA [Ruegeria halocynthiae]|uniref:Threonine/homoserine efflux transporter RhtA n=1 Tax=Ruegeria halocynthiae TaxID=985054 RepID=A0A1H2UAY1_9RHOB|nr:DMT family transporter [Ruegeria halocynthiae]SDW53353.1 Threonine/homoserine efflux transporter RhtA [Ruegeria halocynthiae]
MQDQSQKTSVLQNGLFLGFLAAFLWGTHSVIVRYLTSDLGGLQIAVSRLFIAAFAIYCMLRVMGARVSVQHRDWNFRLAVLSTVVNYILFHIGLEHTGAANAMVLENTAPFFVLIFLYFFADTTVGRTDVLATLLAILGVFLTVYRDFQGGGEPLLGDLMEIGAGLSWAVFLISSSRAMQSSETTAERLNFLFGIFLCSGVLLVPLAAFSFQIPTANDVIFLILLGVLPTALAYYLWYEAAARVSTLTATLLFAGSVVFTFVNSALFLGASITPLAIVGAVLIVTAIFVTTMKSTKEK